MSSSAAKVTVKVIHASTATTRKFQLARASGTWSYNDLISIISKRFSITFDESNKYKLSYLDEADNITVVSPSTASSA
jgi:hypothetical protein